jgi:signal transduction histidine kinase
MTVNHLNFLLSNILIMGKSESNLIMVNPHKINLEDFCRNLLEEIKSNLSPKHDLKFLNQGTVQPREVYLDESLLRQILENLLSNAIKYSPQGGEIRFMIEYNAHKVCFQIQDSGIGILEEDREYLFQSFHRGKNVDNLPGTGLGLAIVKKAVDIQQGQITVESLPGKGSLFSVTLPLYH